MPPPPLPYPTGRCDSLAAGLPGLNSATPVLTHRLIGRSVLGRFIWAEYRGPDRPRATIVVVGQIHGNECAPTLLVEELRRNSPEGIGVWLIPTLNPDGYAAYSRRNHNVVDLNADGGLVSQPETKALFDFVASVRPSLTIHVHAPNGFAGTHPNGAPVASRLCLAISSRTGIRCSGGGAGVRFDRSRWFLWQGLQSFGGESLLVELHAVSDAEVPTARPRPPTRTVDQVRAEARSIVAVLAELL